MLFVLFWSFRSDILGGFKGIWVDGFVCRDKRNKAVGMFGLWKGDISILVKCWLFSRAQGSHYSLVSGCLVFLNGFQCRSVYSPGVRIHRCSRGVGRAMEKGRKSKPLMADSQD
jgi:hypothetical protein